LKSNTEKKLGGKHFLPPVIKLELHISSLFSDNTFLEKGYEMMKDVENTMLEKKPVKI
jgi:hypothetical protein